MRATWIQKLLLVAAAATAAAAFALAAGPHGGSEAAGTPLRMPAETGSVVDVRPAPGRPESSPGPVVRAPATPIETTKPAKAAPRPRPRVRPRLRPRVRVVTVPGVVLTRAEPTKPRFELVRAKPKHLVTATRKLAALPEPESEPMHDNRPRPHE
jgi:hypothetical protein